MTSSRCLPRVANRLRRRGGDADMSYARLNHFKVQLCRARWTLVLSTHPWTQQLMRNTDQMPLSQGNLRNILPMTALSNRGFDLGKYVRQVFTAQDSRRFVLGFTLCGFVMRVRLFDRLGGISSPRFDTNKDGLQLMRTLLGFIWMDEDQLGFEPTITRSRFIACIRFQ